MVPQSTKRFQSQSRYFLLSEAGLPEIAVVGRVLIVWPLWQIV